MSLASGTRLRRYELRAPLGAGGMGEVYLAHDLELERNVAIKVLPADVAESADRLLRFAQEAKLSSALNHPNVAHVYEIGEQDGIRFIAMELVEGETLRRRLAGSPLSIDEALTIAVQIASALGAAHAAGIVHRDIKPENVMIRPDGYIKVLDFGLAKLREFRGDDAATAVKTRPGTAMGTIQYMAPEQLAGSEVDPRADLFSLGVVLYEMLSGHRPFEAENSAEVMAAILTKAPLPISNWRDDVPPELQEIVSQALSKRPEDRHASAAEMLAYLRRAQSEIQVQAIRSNEFALHSGKVATPGRSWKPLAGGAAALLVLILVAGGVISAMKKKRVREALQSLATAESLIEKGDFAEAYATASAASALLPRNDRIARAIAESSDELIVESDPAGARVYLQRFGGPDERTLIGTTPLRNARIARADYILTAEKDGYTPLRRPLSTTPIRARGLQMNQPPPRMQLRLRKLTETPAGMAHVAGGEYQLLGWSRASDRAVALDDFFIDECEVSNADFQQFVRDGGYRRRDFWRNPFVKDGKTLSFEEAMSLFRDTTGLAGPRSWVGGQPPPGRENEPVTGVSWYEAEAFAAWKGKKLPTVYQWERAARPPQHSVFGNTLPWGIVPEGIDVTKRANFSSQGPLAVRSMPFGISPFGAHHMAGNVSEWCRNPRKPGYVTRGGSWNDPVYSFGATGSYPAFYSSETLGFRCVRETGRGGDQGELELSASGFSPRYTAVNDAAFAEIRGRYDYANTPLAAVVTERKETGDWTREKIRYVGAGGKVVPAYLYLPKGFERPLQVIHFIPAGDVAGGRRTAPASVERGLPLLIRAGRAVFVALLEGYLERPREQDPADPLSAQYADEMVAEATDLRRGLDYLATRNDVDTTRLAMLASSAGAGVGVIVAAIEPRYRSVMFVGSGIRRGEEAIPAAANRINFAPRIGAPKLLLQGRYDESDPLTSEAEPLFALWREPKRLEVFEGGHVPQPDVMFQATTRFFDETLGPVAR